MSGLLPSLRASVRIARREALRARGRSVLVIAMIALPVFGMSLAAVTYRSTTLTPAQQADRDLGRADAMLTWQFDGPIRQVPIGGALYSDSTSKNAGTHRASDIAALLPAGTRILPYWRGQIGVRTAGGGVGSVNATELDLTDPVTTGIYRLLRGRAPRSAGEVALTPAAAARTGLRVGGTLRTSDERAGYRVVGLVEDPKALGNQMALFSPAAGLAHGRSAPASAVSSSVISSSVVSPGVDSSEPVGSSDPGILSDPLAPAAGQTSWLVRTPTPVTWTAVEALNSHGIYVESRDVLLHPPPPDQIPGYVAPGTPSAGAIALGTLAAGAGLLEVVLLAGPAFAVGVRRRRRDLALIAATGATPAQLRRVVLADGLVLGLAGAVAGIGLGVLAAAAGRPLVEQYLLHSREGGMRLYPVALLGAAGVALLAGLLAALAPAVSAARMDVVAALAGRRGVLRSRWRWLVVGLALVAVGVALAGYGGWRVNSRLVLAGFATGEFGLVLCTPATVGLVSRPARWLPLAPRMALRHTARTRGATAPAISAVMAAVAASVALGMYLTAGDSQSQAGYRPSLPPGYVSIGLPAAVPVTPVGGDPATVRPLTATSAARILRDHLPAAGTVTVTGTACPAVPGGSCDVRLEVPTANRCPYSAANGMLTGAVARAANRDPRCAWWAGYYGNGLAGTGVGLVVADDAVLATLTGAPPVDLARMDAVLRQGGVLVSDPVLLHDGTATLVIESCPPGTGATCGPGAGGNLGPSGASGTAGTTRRITVPAAVISGAVRGYGFISPALVARLGLTGTPSEVVAATTRMPNQTDLDRTVAALAALGLSPDDATQRLYVERGAPATPQNPIGWVLALVAGVISLVAAAIATGLAAAEGRADLTTLAAVGAAPWVRRLLSIGQAGVIAGVGALLGAAAGLGGISAVLLALNRAQQATWPAPAPYRLLVPWQSLAVALLVVPAVAMLGAGLFTRSRLPVERRAG